MRRQRLKGRIVEKYDTIGAFAEEMGITRQAVSNIINGRSTPPMKRIPVWCAKLGIEPNEALDYFFTIKPQESKE